MVSGVEESLHLMEEKLEDQQPSSKTEIANDGIVDSANKNAELPTGEKGEGSNVVFSRESPLLAKDPQNPEGCKGRKPRSKGSDSTEEFGTQKKGKKLCKQERIELGRIFQGAVSSHDWKHAESLIRLADPQTQNDALCITLDSTWFLTTRQEVNGTTGLLRKIVANGAHDFTRALLRTSFLASCVAACGSSTMSVADTVNFMAQRLHERLQECNGDEKLKAEAGAKAQKFTEWALKCIGFHSRCQESRGRGGGHQSMLLEIHLQLLAFKAFLGLAGNNLTGKDFSEAFDAACFPLTLFSTSFDTGWASGIPAASMQGLLGLLVEGGADNVNQCFLEASRFGSTELVRMLLQIAQRNSLDVDVDLALGFASHYSNITTMKCLVEEGHTRAFLGPLMHAAERGSIEVVQWFVNRGCRDMELCLALSSAISSSQIEVAAYLLPHVPLHVLSAISVDILKTASERSGGSHDGVAFLLRSDFLGDPTSTYAVADGIARAETEETAAMGPELRAFLKEHWSEEAFWEGVRIGEDHYVNFMRVLTKGRSGIVLNDLPPPLVTAVVYLPLYRECVAAGGGPQLLSQRLRGELVEAVRRLGNGQVENENQEGRELLRVLEHYLHPFLIA